LTLLAVAAVVVAWLGGAFLVLSDARRGVALGVALYAADCLEARARYPVLETWD
jgi:hypothetical protein